MTIKATFATMMIRAIGLSCFVAAGATLLAGPPALAQEPRPLGEFQDWAAYTYESDSGAVCYIVSQPTDWEPKNVNRGPIFFLVTHRPAERVRNEVNTIIGYPFREDSTATVTIGDANFELFTSGDGAWADYGRPRPANRRGHEGRHDHAPARDVLARHQYHRPLLAARRDRRHDQDRRGVQLGSAPALPCVARPTKACILLASDGRNCRPVRLYVDGP
jgi:hypothetical protein